MVYIVILNWNNWRDTIACLESVLALADVSYKVVVCDNASTDGSAKNIMAWLTDKNTQQRFLFLSEHAVEKIQHSDAVAYQPTDGAGVYVVETGANLGYAGGNNVGLRLALADQNMRYAWILNNDTQVAPSALFALVETMKDHPRMGICGSTLLQAYHPEKIQAIGGRFGRWSTKTEHVLGGQKFDSVLCQEHEGDHFDYVVGASALVSRAFLEAVGLMEEGYFLYFEELDWAERARRHDPPFTLGYASKSLVFHKEGAASYGKPKPTRLKGTATLDRYFARSRLRFVSKFYPRRMISARMLILMGAIRRLFLGEFHRAGVLLREALCWSSEQVHE